MRLIKIELSIYSYYPVVSRFGYDMKCLMERKITDCENIFVENINTINDICEENARPDFILI